MFKAPGLIVSLNSKLKGLLGPVTGVIKKRETVVRQGRTYCIMASSGVIRHPPAARSELYRAIRKSPFAPRCLLQVKVSENMRPCSKSLG